MMDCRNPNPAAICLCPDTDRNIGPRDVLRRWHINGWVSARLTYAANKLAEDQSVSEERLWRMIFTLEDEANCSMECWRQSQ